MAPVGFEPTISAGERPQTYALARTAIGTGDFVVYYAKKKIQNHFHGSVDLSVPDTLMLFSAGLLGK